MAALIEHIWFASQCASLALSSAVLVGVRMRFLYGSAYFAVVVSLAVSLFQASVAQQQQQQQQQQAKTKPEDSIPPKEPLHDVASYLREAQRLWAVAKPNVKPFLTNKSMPYFILALFQWLYLKKLVISLVPFAIFAFFHVLSHLSNSVIPSVTFISTPSKQKAKQIIESIKAKFSSKAMIVTIYAEIACFLLYTGNALGWFVLKLVGRGSGFFVNIAAVVVWYLFLVVRFDESITVKQVVKTIVSSIDGILADPRIPAELSVYWTQAKQFTSTVLYRVKVLIQ